VVGRTAVGKSMLVRMLNQELNWRVLSIDQAANWSVLVRQIKLLEQPAIIESVLMPRSYREALAMHSVRTLFVVCDERIRQDRLAARVGLHRASDYRSAWPRALGPSRTVDATRPIPRSTLVALVAWARRMERDG
jgi:hypothetical protein